MNAEWYNVGIVDGVYVCTGHTRTSILRLSIGGGQFTEPEIILPETRAIFERQAQRKMKALAGTLKAGGKWGEGGKGTIAPY